MGFRLGKVEEDLALPQQVRQGDRSGAPWVLEVDVPEPVLVQVADGDPLVTGVFLEAKVSCQAFAGDTVARNVADDNMEPVPEQKSDEGVNKVRVGRQRPSGFCLLQDVWLDKDSVAGNEPAQKEFLAACKNLGQSPFVVVVDPVDPCLHACLRLCINRIVAAARYSSLFLCRDVLESCSDRVACWQQEGQHYQD